MLALLQNIWANAVSLLVVNRLGATAIFEKEDLGSRVIGCAVLSKVVGLVVTTKLLAGSILVDIDPCEGFLAVLALATIDIPGTGVSRENGASKERDQGETAHDFGVEGFGFGSWL